MTRRTYKWLSLVICLVICLAAGGIGSVFMRMADWAWYEALAKPSWRPPNWLFGPVWTALYVLMAVAAWQVWILAKPGKASAPLFLFGLQLSFNAAWTGLFFAMQSPLAGLVDIAVLWVLIAATLAAFWRVKVLAGALMIPYLAWVSFASALNFAIWRLNA